MKIISLNTYGGCFFEPLIDFISQHQDSDFFCFQELLNTQKDIIKCEQFRANFFEEINKVLPNFSGTFSTVQSGVVPVGDTDKAIDFGLGLFFKNDFLVKSQGDAFIVGNEKSYEYGKNYTLPFKMQWADFEIDGKILTVVNVHGTAFPFNKLDTPERLEQSQRILDLIKQKPGEKIIMGDFNLFPNTKSISLFEEAGLKNLIKDFNITTTRGSLVRQLHPEYGQNPNGWQEFADYTFVSSGIKVKSFNVPDLPLSDHLPMILEFSQ